MKTFFVALLVLSGLQGLRADDIIVQRLQGEVAVRHGVTEAWTKIAIGDVLKPDDTMKTGKKSSAVISVGNAKRISIPPEVIVDASDFRTLTQDELMLKLTMEKVRSTSYQWKNDELNLPNTTAVHGPDKSTSTPLLENDLQNGALQMNGARLLFDNSYFSTCALRGLEIFRLYPPMGEKFENRFLVAQSLEKANLRGEALNHYTALSAMEGLTPEQKEIVKGKMAQLRKQ
jgi:hypothetical protein